MKEKMVFEMTFGQYMELWLILYRNKDIPSYAVPLTKQDYERKVDAIIKELEGKKLWIKN